MKVLEFEEIIILSIQKIRAIVMTKVRKSEQFRTYACVTGGKEC